jgi:7-cyano-7-deazaguanine synthase
MKKAIVLLSGGLDSAVTLYIAKQKGFTCRCLIFDYGQCHLRETEAAKKISAYAHCRYELVRIAIPWKGSALLDKKIRIRGITESQGQNIAMKIPATYVSARNIIFLSFAISYAEVIDAQAVFIGAHAQDYSGYPDCRPEFFKAFSAMAEVGTRAGIEKKKRIVIEAPLLHKTKAEIIKTGAGLGVPFALTWSCYRGGKKPCGKCDSCYYRKRGFHQAGIRDVF